MNKADNIEIIRQLVERYYSGTATPDEVGAITDFFRQNDVDDLPEDLRADAMIFTETALAKATAPVPDGLESRLESFIDSLPEKTTRRRGVIIRLSLSAAAAVAVVLSIGLGIVGRHADSNDEPFNSALMAEEIVPAPTDTLSVVSENTLIPDESIAEVTAPAVKKSAPTVKHRPKAVAVKEFAAAAEADDYHYAMASDVCEISDPEEASRVAAQVLGMLGRMLGMAGDAIVKSDTEANKIPNAINKIATNKVMSNEK